jgi:predicted amidohydrolase
MKTFTTALMQFQGPPDPEASLREFEARVGEAASQGAQLVCGPEYLYFTGDVHELHRLATPIPGPLTERLSAIAKKHSIYFAPGTIPERSESGKPYNTVLLFGPDGILLGKYRKRHLFRVDIPGELTTDERDDLSGGTEPAPIIDTELGRIGLSICYDLRFPEQFLNLSLRGAEIIVVPAAFPIPTGSAHWHVLCRARAIETGCFILATARVGACGVDTPRYGHSLIVDPWGTVLAEAGKNTIARPISVRGSIHVEKVEREDISIISELRAESLAEARARMRSIDHRIPGDSLPDPSPHKK